jgi:hypothetical protein
MPETALEICHTSTEGLFTSVSGSRIIAYQAGTSHRPGITNPTLLQVNAFSQKKRVNVYVNVI